MRDYQGKKSDVKTRDGLLKKKHENNYANPSSGLMIVKGQ